MTQTVILQNQPNPRYDSHAKDIKATITDASGIEIGGIPVANMTKGTFLDLTMYEEGRDEININLKLIK